MKLRDIGIVDRAQYNEFLNLLLILDHLNVVYAEDLHQLLGLLGLILVFLDALHPLYHLADYVPARHLLATLVSRMLLYPSPRHLVMRQPKSLGALIRMASFLIFHLFLQALGIFDLWATWQREVKNPQHNVVRDV